MNNFRLCSTILVISSLIATGCASHQYGHILAHDDKDLVGSHAAGAATWNPLVDESVAKLLGRCPPPDNPIPFQPASSPFQPASFGNDSSATIGSALAVGPANICFIGIENKSAEELGDFKDQLYEQIDQQINAAGSFRAINRRMVDAALRETRLRPDSLYLPHNREQFAAALGRQGAPVDYLMYANVTSGTTDRNKTTQRDYLLTLELVNLHTGETLKESAKIRKGYSKTRTGKWWNFGFFDQADG
ncbi:MAG: penicillin-binding protein activator LpoB [Planctomycetota bacterium]